MVKETSKVDYLYIFRLERDKQIIRYIYDISLPGEDTSDYGSFLSTFIYDPIDFRTAFAVINTGKVSQNLEVTKTSMGYLASAYAPIMISKGEVVALVGVDIEMQSMIDEKNAQLMQIMQKCGSVIALCFLVLLIIIQLSAIRPIRILKGKVKEMSDGTLGVQAKLQGRNEITEIARIFNQMSKSIEGHFLEMEGLNRAYDKFIPSRIFELLHKKALLRLACLTSRIWR